jgi:hypothetical protein
MVGKCIVIFLCMLVALLACPYATAATTGILAGTVTDLDGNGIEGATVSLYRGQNLVMIEKNPQATISGYDKGPVGHYGFKGITPGKYRIVVEKTVSSGVKYTAEQQVTVVAGTVIQDIVLLIPEPTAQPTPNTYYADNTSPADGFGAFIAIVSVAGAILLMCRRDKS